MREWLFFDKMVTPKIITVVYWLLLLGVAVGGLVTMSGGFRGPSLGSFLGGIVVAVGGALGVRIWCELLIVLFKMNEALQDLRQRGGLGAGGAGDGQPPA
jgi:hypothetical protein